MANQTIFDIIRDGERKSPNRYPVFFVKMKDLKTVVRQIRNSIPLRRDTGEPIMHLDIESAIRQGRIRISNTTLRVQE